MIAPEPVVAARFQTALPERACRCDLCPRHCVIKPGHHGFCRHRENRDGQLYAAQYGRAAAVALDPIEKKPLYHFHPGTAILSVGSVGCNLACRFCQNWHLSTGVADTQYLAPDRLVAQARTGGSIGVAFTYNEPLIWFEYIFDAAALLKKQGLAVVLVSNGYLEPEPFAEICRWVDAMNIDVKGDDEFYRQLTGGSLAPVRHNVETAHKAGVHVEVTNLLVTDANDADAQVGELVDWLAGISRRIPLHLSRYFPNHKYQAPPTPLGELEQAAMIARAKLDYVFIGNAQIPGSSDTCCPACGDTVIKRRGYHTDIVGLAEGGRCAACGAALGVVR